MIGTDTSKMAYLANNNSSSSVTVRGAIVKSLISLMVLIVFGAVGFYATQQYLSIALISVFLSFVLIPVVLFSHKYVGKVTTLGISSLEGFVVGSFSFILTSGNLHGQVQQAGPIIALALLATISSVVAAGLLYFAGVIKVGQKFKSISYGALFAIFIFYLCNFAISFFLPEVSASLRTGPLGLIISVVVILVALANLISTFDDMVIMENNMADKKYEWHLALSVVILVVWIYMEMLKIITRYFSNS